MNSRQFGIIFFSLGFLIPYHSIADDDSSITIAGTGDSQFLLRSLAEKFRQTFPARHITINIPDSVGSSGGVKALINNRVTLARTARKLKADERKFNLKEFPFASSPVVFVVHPSVTGIDNLTKQQVIDIYRKKYSHWDQLGGPAVPIYPIQREQGDSSRTVLEKRMSGFRGHKKIKIYYTTPDAAQALSQYKYTIGYLPLSTAKTYKLKVMAFNGVEANEDNVNAGKYKLISPFYLVAKGIPGGYAGKFIEFLGSQPAKATIRAYGAIPN